MVWQIVGMLAIITVIGLSIALHEVGHLAPAKRFGVRVSDYAIGFGPSLFSRRIGETLYALRLIPVGGYIRMIGMYPPAPVGHQPKGRLGRLAEEARAEAMAEVLPSDAGRAFYELPVHKRIVVMLGGPSMNALLAVLFFAIALMGVGVASPSLTVDAAPPCIGTSQYPDGERVDGSCPGGVAPAAAAGVKAGDTIVAINERPVEDWLDLDEALRADADGGPGTVTVLRNGIETVLDVDYVSVERVAIDEAGNPTGETFRRAYLGVQPTWERQRLGIGTVGSVMWNMTTGSLKAMGQFPQKVLELGRTLLTDGERDINGPVSVVGATRIGGEIAAADWDLADKINSLLMLAGSLNLFLFLFNLVPLLPLDGGHVAAALYEMVRNGLDRLRGRARRGPADTARMLPITYAMSALLIGVGGLVIWADIVKPISLGG